LLELVKFLALCSTLAVALPLFVFLALNIAAFLYAASEAAARSVFEQTRFMAELRVALKRWWDDD